MSADKIPQEVPITQAHLENKPIHKNLLNQKGSFLLILGLVIIIIVFGAGGYLLTMNKNQNSNQYISQPTPTSTQPTSLNEIESWKIYQNAIFSFKYPDTATPHDINDQYTDVSINFKYPGSPDGCELCDGYLLAFKSGKLNNQSLEEVAEKTLKEKEGYGSITQSLKSVSINSYSGLTFSYTVQIATTEIYLSDGKGNYIEIRESIDDPQKRGYGKTIDQILSTFKFTDQNQANVNSSWKTYKNSKYGFELQHPENSTVETSTNGGVNPYQYIRIQNYTDQDVMKNNGRLVAGQYYLEISIYDHQLGQKNTETCPESLADPKKVDFGTGATAYRGNGLGGGDSAPYIYAICATKPNVDYYIQASENFDTVASKIIDSFKFTN